MGEMVASAYTLYVKDKGMDIITWTLERSGLLEAGGGWYFQTLNGGNDNSDTNLVEGDGFAFEMLEALHQEVGILGIFSDWPATTTFYANCMDLGIAAVDEEEEEEDESTSNASVQIGDRPFFLVEQMEDSDLKTTLGKLPIQFESVIPPAT